MANTSSTYNGAVVRHDVIGRAATVKSATNRGAAAYLLHVELPGGKPDTWLSEDVTVISRPRPSRVPS